VEKYHGYPIAFDVHPDYNNLFLNSKKLNDLALKMLDYLKRYQFDDAEIQTENMKMQRAIIKITQ